MLKDARTQLLYTLLSSFTLLGLLWVSESAIHRSRLHAAPAATGHPARHSATTIPQSCDAPLRVMPLGDSITRGSGSPFFTGYRQPLYTNLRGAGYDVDFVGDERNGGGTALSFDIDNEGHSGETADWIADRVFSFLNANPADIVLLHIGTNDLLNGDTPATATEDVERILERVDDWENDNNELVVVLARIINRATVDPQTSEYNNQLAEMAQSRIDGGDQIVLVDMENSAGLEYQESGPDWGDSIHPSYHGYQKMAALWLSRMRNELAMPECLPLQVSISADRTLVNSGENVQFTVTVTNDGDTAITDLAAVNSPAAPCNRNLADLPAGESISYNCTVSNFTSDTIIFVDVAGTMAGSGDLQNTAMVHITVRGQNTAPVIDLNGPDAAGSNRSVRFTEDKAPVRVAHPDALLIDPAGNGQIAGAILTLTNPLDGTQERLAADVAGTSIEAVYSAGSATLELRNQDTIANYQKVLRSVTYENSSQNPSTAARRIEVSATDVEIADRNVSVTTVSIAPVNDAPALGGTLQLNVLRRNDQRITPTILQAVDVDNEPGELVYTLKTVPRHGQLQLDGSVLTEGDTFSQLDIDRGRLRYVHSIADAHKNATEDAFNFSVADGAGGRIDNGSLPIAIVDEEDTYLPFTPRS